MYRLAPHPAALPVAASGVSLMWMEMGGGNHQLTWRIENAARLLLPMQASRERADGLWQMTCCELFLRRQAGPAYFEFNFSPSQRWAAYSFADYRDGMAPWPMERAPLIEGALQGDDFVMRVSLSGLPPGMTIAGLAAVVVERSLPAARDCEGEGGGGDMGGGEAEAEPAWEPASSLWALTHPAAVPDFHHPGSFSLPLAPGFR